MELTKCLVPGTDLAVSRIAYGTFMLGHDDREVSEAIETLSRAFDLGINFFDSSNSYGNGRAESFLGEMLRKSPISRHDVIIQSKCASVTYSDGSNRSFDVKAFDLSREHILTSVEQSLKRLGTDYLDILLLHCPDPLMNPHEVAEAFDRLESSGKVRHFGVSNFGITSIELLKSCVRQPLVANQIRLGLAYCGPMSDLYPAPWAAMVDYCRINKMQVQAYSTLRGGILSPAADAAPALKKVSDILIQLGHKYDVEPSAIALAWILRHPAGIIAILGTASPEHIMENCRADRISLSRDEWYSLFLPYFFSREG